MPDDTAAPLPGLRAELVEAAARQAAARNRSRRRPSLRRPSPHPRPRRRALTVSVPAMAFAVVAAVVATSMVRTPAEADVEVKVSGDVVSLLITRVEADPAVIEDAARSVGVDLTVRTVATGPSRYGRFVRAQGDQIPGEVRTVGGVGAAFTGFEVPKGWDGQLTLALGAPAAGEPYAVASDAYAPGEPLECSGLFGARLSGAAAQLSDLPLTVRFTALDQPTPVSFDSAQGAPDAYEDWYLIDASAVSADEVLIYLNDEPTSPFMNSAPPDQSNCP